MTPMPFKIVGDEYIYVPSENVHRDGVTYGTCTRVCSQFLDYPVDANGVRIIQINAPCVKIPGALCRGAFVCVDGEFVRSYLKYKSVWKGDYAPRTR